MGNGSIRCQRAGKTNRPVAQSATSSHSLLVRRTALENAVVEKCPGACSCIMTAGSASCCCPGNSPRRLARNYSKLKVDELLRTRLRDDCEIHNHGESHAEANGSGREKSAQGRLAVV